MPALKRGLSGRALISGPVVFRGTPPLSAHQGCRVWNNWYETLASAEALVIVIVIVVVATGASRRWAAIIGEDNGLTEVGDRYSVADRSIADTIADGGAAPLKGRSARQPKRCHAWSIQCGDAGQAHCRGREAS